MLVSSLAVAEGLKDALREERLACPSGSQLVGDAPPHGKGIFCVRQIIGANAQKHGPFMLYHRQGGKKASGNYTFGMKNGTFFSYHLNGKLKEKTSYVKGVLDGEHLKYYADGTLSIREFIKNSKVDGRKEMFHMNGSPKFEGSFVQGRPEGATSSWHQNGARKFVGFFKNGIRSGSWTTYHPNGEKKATIGYRDGRPNGTVVYYRPDGSIKKQVEYARGRIVRTTRGEDVRHDSNNNSSGGLAGLEKRDARKFAAWDRSVKQTLTERRKNLRAAGGEFIPTEQRSRDAWDKRQEKFAQRQAALAERKRNRLNSQLEGEKSPMAGLFKVGR